MSSNNQHPGDVDRIEYIPESAQECKLTSLYTRYVEQLNNPSLILQDDVLKILVEMEETMESILSKKPIEVSSLGSHLPNLENRMKDHFHRTLAQESELMKSLGMPGLSTQNLLSQIGHEVDKLLSKNIFLSEKNTRSSLDVWEWDTSSTSLIPSALSSSSSTENRFQKGKILWNNPSELPEEISPETQWGISSYEDTCKKFKIIYTKHSDGKNSPFVPTQDTFRIQKWSGRGFESGNKQTQKFYELIGLLRNISTPDGGFIDTRDIIVDFQEETPNDMIRMIPYLVVRIPRLDRSILISDEIWEATFIFDSVIDISITRSQNKKEFVFLHWAKRFVYDENWWRNVEESLLNNWREEDEKSLTKKVNNEWEDRGVGTHLPIPSWDSISTSTSQKNTIKPRIKMDRAVLFLDRENIWKDLEAFRVKGGLESIEKLNTENPKPSDEAELSNGEKMKWNNYLLQAKRYLPKPNWLEEYKQASALDELCRMIGVDREKRLVLGQEYFQNKNNIWKDLEAFQVVGGVESLEKLGIGNPKTRDEAELSNGEKMSWETYLTQAIKHLPKPKEWEEYKLASVLDELCRMIGVERVKK